MNYNEKVKELESQITELRNKEAREKNLELLGKYYIIPGDQMFYVKEIDAKGSITVDSIHSGFRSRSNKPNLSFNVNRLQDRWSVSWILRQIERNGREMTSKEVDTFKSLIAQYAALEDDAYWKLLKKADQQEIPIKGVEEA
jgi:hypothetical protein